MRSGSVERVSDQFSGKYAAGVRSPLGEPAGAETACAVTSGRTRNKMTELCFGACVVHRAAFSGSKGSLAKAAAMNRICQSTD